jgi:hypothetical protein
MVLSGNARAEAGFIFNISLLLIAGIKEISRGYFR